MNVTLMINKIFYDYENTELTVNTSIKYRFMYNGYQTDVFYTTANGLQSQLLICIAINDTDYLSTLYFSKNANDEYFMNYYLTSDLYEKVKFSLLYRNGRCAATPYFESMVQAIMNNAPIPSHHIRELKSRNLYQYKYNEDKPFFDTIIRKNMSNPMKKKINNKYGSAIAQQIITFCGSNRTLRFTSDFTKSKDILTYMKQFT